MQLEGGSIWVTGASGCREVILSHPFFFGLYFLLIRTLLILQLEPFFSFCKAMIFHIVILSFFRLPRGGRQFFLCSRFAHCLPPSSSWVLLGLLETYYVGWVVDPSSLFIYRELKHTTLLASYFFLVTSIWVHFPPFLPLSHVSWILLD